MKYLSFILCHLFCVQLVSEVLAGEIKTSNSCETVGRVTRSFDSGILAFSALCAGGTLVVGDRLKVQISCFSQARDRWIQGGSYNIDELCKENRSIRSLCWWIDCERSPNSISLINPRSSSTLGVSNLEWTPVKGTIFYEVRISSHSGRTFQGKTSEPRYEISEKYKFFPGDSYEIKILATSSKSIIAEGIFSLRIPGITEMQALEDSLKQIQNSKIPKIDKIKLTDSAYMSHGLIEKTIVYLEEKFEETSSSEIASILGDRYSALNDAIKAEKHYQFVIREEPETSKDFAFAKIMLARIATFKSS